MWTIKTTDTFDNWFTLLNDIDRVNVLAALLVLLNIHLAELREKVQKTQVEMAQALGVRQPTVAGMEKPGRDLKLSTLKRYVEATGGKLRLDKVAVD
ncbi:Antitoxin HigA1 [Mixta theicola]|nr:Antitoxin HigA1 [Mixta theicola]